MSKQVHGMKGIGITCPLRNTLWVLNQILFNLSLQNLTGQSQR